MRARHISAMLQDLYAALDEGRPWSMVRLGDGELHALRGVHTPWSYIENRCATVGDAGDLRQHSLLAIGDADWVGWHQDYGLVSALEAGAMLPRGWTEAGKQAMHDASGAFLGWAHTWERAQEVSSEAPPLYERSQFAWCNLHMGIRRGFVERVLRDEPLFLAGEPMQRWLDEVLRPAGLGEGAVVWQGESTIGTMRHAMQVVKGFEASGVRVMFASLGVWALPIVGRVKSLGGIALDWGHLPDHNLKAHEPHWQYRLNTCCEDSPAGTMAHYRHGGTAHQCLPEEGY